MARAEKVRQMYKHCIDRDDCIGCPLLEYEWICYNVVGDEWLANLTDDEINEAYGKMIGSEVGKDE